MDGSDFKKLLGHLAKKYPEINQKQELIKKCLQWFKTAKNFGSDSPQAQNLMQWIAKLNPEIAQEIQGLIEFGKIIKERIKENPELREEISKDVELIKRGFSFNKLKPNMLISIDSDPNKRFFITVKKISSKRWEVLELDINNRYDIVLGVTMEKISSHKQLVFARMINLQILKDEKS